MQCPSPTSSPAPVHVSITWELGRNVNGRALLRADESENSGFALKYMLCALFQNYSGSLTKMHELQMWVNHLTRLPLAFLFSHFLLVSAFSPSWSSIRTPPVCPIPPQAPRFPDARVLISLNVSLET